MPDAVGKYAANGRPLIKSQACAEISKMENLKTTTDKQRRKYGFQPGVSGNPAGRRKGKPNKITRTIKASTLEAFEELGGVQWLVQMGRGTSDDRRAFMGLLARILPAEINANVQGGVTITLNWLDSRKIGTSTAQLEHNASQVIDLATDNDGVYKIMNPSQDDEGIEDHREGLD